jgi:ABC-type transport system involved in cytochrome c biogenesis ATPase subunit
MRVAAHSAALGALRGADLDLTPGRYVVLSNERDALRDLISLLAGRDAPRTGRVLLDGVTPASAPATRHKIAALLGEESLPPARTVLASVAKALAARGDAAPPRAAEVLESASLAQLGALDPRTLGQRELRSVALALALAHRSAELFVLHEPLTTQLPTASVLARLDEHTTRGALVLASTTSPADAAMLGGAWLCLELGRLRSDASATPRLGAGPWQQVLFETNDARRLSQLLHAAPHELSTELSGSAQALKVTGPALDVTVRQVVALARQHGLEIQRIEAAVPPVEALLAARAGFARGAYEASRAAALAGPVVPTPPRSGGVS